MKLRNLRNRDCLGYPSNPLNPSNPQNPPSPSNPPNSLNPSNSPNPPSPSYPSNLCPHPPNLSFKDSLQKIQSFLMRQIKNLLQK